MDRNYLTKRLLTRRELLTRSGMGFATLGLAQLLQSAKVLEATPLANAGGSPHANLSPLAFNVLATRPDTCEKRKSLCEKMGRAYPKRISAVPNAPTTEEAETSGITPSQSIPASQRYMSSCRGT